MTTQAENKVTAQIAAGITGSPDTETTAVLNVTLDCIVDLSLEPGESLTGDRFMRAIIENAYVTIKTYFRGGDGHRLLSSLTVADFYEDLDPKKKLPIPPALRPSWVKSRGLDAETLVEITTLFDMTLWEKLLHTHDLSCTQLHDFIYDACQAFQEIHAATDWDEHGDYWGAVEVYVEKINAEATKDPNWIDWDVQALKRISDLPHCEGCDGSGIRPHSNHDRPHAGPQPDGFVIVERCDTCDKYPDDLAAAQAWGDEARWQEGNGTAQAIAKPRVSHESNEGERPDRSCDLNCSRRLHPMAPCDCSRSGATA